jgi:hypothetical protein
MTWSYSVKKDADGLFSLTLLNKLLINPSASSVNRRLSVLFMEKEFRYVYYYYLFSFRFSIAIGTL